MQWGVVNLMLKKWESVTTGGKGRGEIRDEIGKVTGLIADVPITDSLRKWYGTFGGREMAPE